MGSSHCVKKKRGEVNDGPTIQASIHNYVILRKRFLGADKNVFVRVGKKMLFIEVGYVTARRNMFVGVVTPHPPQQIHFQGRVTQPPAPKYAFVEVGEAPTRSCK